MSKLTRFLVLILFIALLFAVSCGSPEGQPMTPEEAEAYLATLAARPPATATPVPTIIERVTGDPSWAFVAVFIFGIFIYAMASFRRSQEKLVIERESKDEPPVVELAESNVEKDLLPQLVQSFSADEMDVILMSLSIDAETIPRRHEGKTMYFYEVIKYFRRRGDIDKLLRRCAYDRPNIDWNIFLDDDAE